jgi:hypothetical protein
MSQNPAEQLDDDSQNKPGIIRLTLLVEGSALRPTLRGNDAMPLTQTPPLLIEAAENINFALVGDADDHTYHLFTYEYQNPRAFDDLGSTGHSYDPANSLRPRAVFAVLVVQGARIRATLDGDPKSVRGVKFEELEKRRLAFGSSSEATYKIACNTADHCKHLYIWSDGHGGWVDAGRYLVNGRPVPCPT